MLGYGVLSCTVSGSSSISKRRQQCAAAPRSARQFHLSLRNEGEPCSLWTKHGGTDREQLCFTANSNEIILTKMEKYLVT